MVCTRRRASRVAGRDGEDRARAVGRVPVQQVVVHLHHDLASGRKRDAGAVGQAAAGPARRPGGDPVRVVRASPDRAAACRPRRARFRRSTTSPGRASPASSLFASATCEREMRKRITWWTIFEAARLDARRRHRDVARRASGRGGSSGSRRSLRLACRWAVGRRHRELEHALALAHVGRGCGSGLRAGPSTSPPAVAQARIVARCCARQRPVRSGRRTPASSARAATAA